QTSAFSVKARGRRVRTFGLAVLWGSEDVNFSGFAGLTPARFAVTIETPLGFLRESLSTSALRKTSVTAEVFASLLRQNFLASLLHGRLRCRGTFAVPQQLQQPAPGRRVRLFLELLQQCFFTFHGLPPVLVP